MAKRYGKDPKLTCLGTLDELREKVDAARAKGNVGWDVMPL